MNLWSYRCQHHYVVEATVRYLGNVWHAFQGAISCEAGILDAFHLGRSISGIWTSLTVLNNNNRDLAAEILLRFNTNQDKVDGKLNGSRERA
jgi:hypothetical protein